MKTENIFYTSDRAQWRQWLGSHFETETEVWFVFPLKNSGEPGLSYNDAVEEALCFDWIDSIYHAVDQGRALLFTPRRAGSPYSRPNIERLIWLDKQGMLHPGVRQCVADLLGTPYVFPEDIMDTLRADPVAWTSIIMTKATASCL